MHTGKHPGNKRIEGKEGEGTRGGRTPRGNSSTGGLGVGGDDSVCECVCVTGRVCVCASFIRRWFGEQGMLHIQIITDHPYKLEGSQFNHRVKRTHKQQPSSKSSDMK